MIDKSVHTVIYNSDSCTFRLFDRDGNKLRTIADSMSNQAIQSTFRLFDNELTEAVERGEFSERQISLILTRYVRVEFAECPDCGFTMDVCGECGRCAQCCREQGCGQHPQPVKVYRQPTAERHPLHWLIR